MRQGRFELGNNRYGTIAIGRKIRTMVDGYDVSGGSNDRLQKSLMVEASASLIVGSSADEKPQLFVRHLENAIFGKAYA